MLILNGNYFYDRNKESNRDAPEPCSGSYTVNRKTITIFNIAGEKCGVIANGVLSKVTKLANGKWWYSYCKPAIVGEYASYTQYVNDMAEAMKLLNK